MLVDDIYFPSDTTFNFGIPDINITSIVWDKKLNCLWLGTWNYGIFQLDLSTYQYKNFKHNRTNPAGLSSNNTYKLFLDSRNDLWIGTWGGGLNKLNRADQSFEQINLNVPGLYTNDNQIVLTIHEDPSGILWVGTDGTGVFKFNLRQKKFFNLGYELQKSSLESTHILSVYVDPYQKLWLGTKGGGIQYSEDWNNFKKIQIQDKPVRNAPTALYESRAFLQDGNFLWVATSNGLVRLVNDGKRVGNPTVFVPEPKDSNSISGKKINVLVKDANGRIWIGTQENGLSYIARVS